MENIEHGTRNDEVILQRSIFRVSCSLFIEKAFPREGLFKYFTPTCLFNRLEAYLFYNFLIAF